MTVLPDRWSNDTPSPVAGKIYAVFARCSGELGHVRRALYKISSLLLPIQMMEDAEQKDELDPRPTGDAADVVAAEPDSAEPAEEVAELSTRAARELGALEAVLRKTRRRIRGPLITEGVAWFIATIGAVMATAQFVGLALGESGPGAMRLVLLLGGTATALGGVVALWGFFRTNPSLEQVARILQRQVAEFRSDLVAALQFGAALRDGVDAEAQGWSAELAYTHLRRTARATLAKVDGGGTLGGLLAERSLTPALVAIGGCLALLVGPILIASEQVGKLWTEVAFSSLEEQKEVPDHRPIVGDIDLSFSFPPYTNLQPRLDAFTTGQIDTLIGTEVTLSTYALVRAISIDMIIRNVDGERSVPMKSTGGRLKGTLLLTKPGSYTFRATLADGTVLEDGIERPIVLQPDQPPTVAITSHSGEVEVSPDETLTLRYTIGDDYGVEAVSRVTVFGSEEPKALGQNLPELSTRPSSLEQEVTLDLREFSLQPKDTLMVWFEATDNNSLTGPGIGKAAPIILRVASPEDRHHRLIAEEMEVLEALLDVLGDFLEAPVGERSPDAKGFYEQTVAVDLDFEEITKRYTQTSEIHQRQGGVLSQMSLVLDRMKDDPLMTTRDVTLFESLYEQLYGLNRDGAELLNRLAADARTATITTRELQRVADWVSKDEDALEKGLIRLDNLLATQKMDSVKRTADEIRDLKDRLRELLERYRDTKDPELKKTIMREIQRLRQRMAELMARMSSQLKKLPQEHINMEALEQARLESDAKKMGDSLQRMEDLLENDDIDGALAALDEMTASLDQMTQEMGEKFGDAEPEGLREMDKALSELMDKANDLEARQRSLEEKTREEQEEADGREQERVKKLLEKRTAEIARLAKTQREKLERMSSADLAEHDQQALQRARERVEQLQQALKNQDIEQALERAKSSQEDIRALEFSLDLSQKYTEPQSKRGQGVRKTLDDAREARPRARKIVRQLNEVMEQARSAKAASGHPKMSQLAEEQRGVEQQAEQLRKDVDGAGERFPMLQQKLSPPLDAAREEMGKASKGLGKGRPQQALDHQRGALEQLRQLKQSMRDALQKQNQRSKKDGPGSSRQDRVTIPENDGRSQEDFREDVLEGMKQQRLEDYGSEIQRYYESLME